MTEDLLHDLAHYKTHKNKSEYVIWIWLLDLSSLFLVIWFSVIAFIIVLCFLVGWEVSFLTSVAFLCMYLVKQSWVVTARETADRTGEGSCLLTKIWSWELDPALEKSVGASISENTWIGCNAVYLGALWFAQDSALLYLVLTLFFWLDVMMSARTLIHLFRSLNPEMLQKKYRVSVFSALHSL